MRPVGIWLGSALLGGLAGALDRTSRHLYRIAGLVLAATLLSPLAMRQAVPFGLPFPHGFTTLLGLDGEHAQDAALYEIWLGARLSSLGLLLLGWYGFVRLLRGHRGRCARHRGVAASRLRR